MAKIALLIGVSDYEPGLNSLPAAVKDVEVLQRILQDPELGNFDEIRVLTNPDPQTMQYEVETLFTGRAKEDLVLLFFSGHGVKDDSNALYFATRITRKNAKGELIRATAVPARFIHEVMNNSRAKRQTIILDCCFSGAFDPALQTKDDGSVDLQSQLGAEGRVVLASSSSTQYSFEQHGSDLSLYTRYLVEGIESGAGDLNEDGKISVRELHEYATSKVHETAPNMTPKLITLKDMGFDVVLAKARITDPKLRYRRQVERYSSRGLISSIGRTILDELQSQLELPPQVAQGIEAEVLRPYQERMESLRRYQEVFSEAVKHEYPLSQIAQSELEDLREVLGLRQQDITSLEQEILAQFSQRSQTLKADGPNTSQRRTELTDETTTDQSSVFTKLPEKPRENVHNLSARNRQSEQTSSNNQSIKNILIAASSGLVLLLGGVLFFGGLSSNNSNNIREGANDGNDIQVASSESRTYTAGNLTITGDTQHVCNLLLPRGPGIGSPFFYPEEEALWQELECATLYCDLSDVGCRTSLKSQWAFPDQLPTSSGSLTSLSIEQVALLNEMYDTFDKVNDSSEPVERAHATTFGGWNAICIGEEGQAGCPKSAQHEINSLASYGSDSRFWTSRGWVFYKP